mmetsp:Transcript_15394/g.39707  ORF Transcript_15394/g.39707 Transcript_15394/m.39707 type:complete len:521 (-) Transcript_15394:178-1740(-)
MAAAAAAGGGGGIKNAVLKVVDAEGKAVSTTLAERLKVDHQEVVGAIKSLSAIDVELLEVKDVKVVTYKVTDEGRAFAADGSHEARIFAMVPPEGIVKAELDGKVKGAKLSSQSVGVCMKNKWLKIDKGDGGPVVKRAVEAIDDRVGTVLACMVAEPAAFNEAALKAGTVASAGVAMAEVSALQKRKLVAKVSVTELHLTKGRTFTTTPQVLTSDLTQEMLADGSWATKKFRKFNLDASPAIEAGALHPLLKVRSEFRRIFLEMGFAEMPTDTPGFVESSFWNFDALFQPQQHPARDAHDTFFMSAPETSDNFPEDYLERVKTMHEVGGSGSIGYRYDWQRTEAAKNILRTHTTAVSTRMLYKLGQQKEFKPAKYFSIDRVFRNESLDATHLAEFHQVEGLVADYNLTLGHLIGTLNLFFTRLGMTDIKFKPAYNPYTEPSMEVFAYSKELGKEVEVGNSGIFRPEMLRPMGLPEDVTVIAWGLSVERPTMIKYGYKNIRDLFGASVKLSLVRDNPICQL